MSENVISFNQQTEMFNDEKLVSDTELNTKQLGRYAEFLVCAELSKLGYYVWHCDAPGFDIILVVDEQSLRVQVRATNFIENGYCVWNCRKSDGNRDKNNFCRSRAMDRRDTDLIALHHLIFGTTIFVSVDEISQGGSLRLPVSQIRAHDMSKSLERVLGRFG